MDSKQFFRDLALTLIAAAVVKALVNDNKKEQDPYEILLEDAEYIESDLYTTINELVGSYKYQEDCIEALSRYNKLTKLWCLLVDKIKLVKNTPE
jgi:hypothetical protein